MERYILGIDIGTTSVKALLISESGALAAEGKADHDLISAHPGWAEENAQHHSAERRARGGTD